MRGRWRSWVVACCVLIASVVAVPVAGSRPVTAAAATGRIHLRDPIRYSEIDLLSGMTISVAASMLRVTVIGSPYGSYRGSGWVAPCGTHPDRVRRFHWIGAAVTRLAFTGPASGPNTICIGVDHAAKLVIDDLGTVSPTPDDGLQYVPLARPEVLGILDGAGERSITVPRPSSIPASAGGAVVVVDVGADGGGGTVRGCAHPGRTVDDVPSDGDERGAAGNRGVVLVALGPAEDLCVRGRGSGRVSAVLIGILTTSGPDPTRLPPTLENASELPPAGFVPSAPVRVLDSRKTNLLSPILGGSGGIFRETQLDLTASTTPLTTAVTLNVTATQMWGDGYVTAYPCGEEPEVSNLNFRSGVDTAGLVTVRLSPARHVCFRGPTSGQLVVDFVGRFDLADDTEVTAITPIRTLDTRVPIGVATAGAIEANEPVTLQVTGRTGVPTTGVEAVTLNLTVAQPTGDGFLSVWPCDQPEPEASSLNFLARTDVANLATVKVSAAGTVCLRASAEAHLIADVAAWYGPVAETGLVDLTPRRIFDSRSGPLVAAGQDPGARFTVRGAGGVPAEASVWAAIVNVTVTAATADGYLTVWPCDRPRPEASNLNFRVGSDRANLTLVKLSAGGELCVFTSADTHVIADVAAYLTDVAPS